MEDCQVSRTQVEGIVEDIDFKTSEAICSLPGALKAPLFKWQLTKEKLISYSVKDTVTPPLNPKLTLSSARVFVALSRR